MVLKTLAKLGIIKIPPQAWDALIPHGPKVTQVFVEYMVAGLVRDVARQVSNKSVSKTLMSLSRDMAKASTNDLVAHWDDGDICPPWWPFPWPWPGPWPGPWPEWDKIFNQGPPDPFPLLRVKGIEQLLLADVLVSLSEVTVNVEFSKALLNSAVGIAKTYGSLADDIAGANAKARSLG